MKYKIYSGTDCIGETKLEARDEGMSVSIGVFFPMDEYESVRPFFQSFNEILEVNDFEQQSKLRDQWQKQLTNLDLKLFRWDDVEVPTGWIQIYDFSAHVENDDELEVHAQISDPAQLILK